MDLRLDTNHKNILQSKPAKISTKNIDIKNLNYIGAIFPKSFKNNGLLALKTQNDNLVPIKADNKSYLDINFNNAVIYSNTKTALIVKIFRLIFIPDTGFDSTKYKQVLSRFNITNGKETVITETKDEVITETKIYPKVAFVSLTYSVNKSKFNKTKLTEIIADPNILFQLPLNYRYYTDAVTTHINYYNYKFEQIDRLENIYNIGATDRDDIFLIKSTEKVGKVFFIYSDITPTNVYNFLNSQNKKYFKQLGNTVLTGTTVIRTPINIKDFNYLGIIESLDTDKTRYVALNRSDPKHPVDSLVQLDYPDNRYQNIDFKNAFVYSNTKTTLEVRIYKIIFVPDTGFNSNDYRQVINRFSDTIEYMVSVDKSTLFIHDRTLYLPNIAFVSLTYSVNKSTIDNTRLNEIIANPNVLFQLPLNKNYYPTNVTKQINYYTQTSNEFVKINSLHEKYRTLLIKKDIFTLNNSFMLINKNSPKDIYNFHFFNTKPAPVKKETNWFLIIVILLLLLLLYINKCY